MEIKTSKEIIESIDVSFDCTCENCEGMRKQFEESKDNKKWIYLDEDFEHNLADLESFMVFGYGENKDFRNMGTDYENRTKVFNFIKELNKKISN